MTGEEHVTGGNAKMCIAGIMRIWRVEVEEAADCAE